MTGLVLTKKEQERAENAKLWVRKHKKELIRKFASLENFPPAKNPITVLMAGSPGAGKTEFSKQLLLAFNKKFKTKLVRIDPDEIKEYIPGYNGKNSYIMQGASVIGMEKLIDQAMKYNQDMIIDGTFADYNIAKRNIDRSIKHDRTIVIVYVYFNPPSAWDIAKKREKLEGRFIPKEMFIDALFKAKSNVNKIKKIYRDDVTIIGFIRHEKEPLLIDIDNIDKYVKIPYTKNRLREILL